MPLKALAGGRALPLIEDARRWVRVVCALVVAVFCAALGLGAIGALEPALSRPYVFPAVIFVILSAIVAGVWSGVVATALFCVGFLYFFLDPRGSFALASPRQGVALLVFFITGCVVAGVCGALRRAYARLREQHRVLAQVHHHREDLLRALTHDVRSPLSVISMNAAMVGRRDPEDRRRGIAIANSVRNIDSMLKDLVDVVALESGGVTLELAAIDLSAMVNRLMEGLTGTLPLERVNVAIPGDLPVLCADPPRLERVIVNLLSNALKYSPGKVTVGALLQERNVVVSVHDEGPGIAAADLPHIFAKYYRASNAESQEGMGLGLYITRLLVEAHGGRIWAESSPGTGTTFNVALPVDAPPLKAVRPSEWAPTPPPRASFQPPSITATGTQH